MCQELLQSGDSVQVSRDKEQEVARVAVKTDIRIIKVNGGTCREDS